MKYFEQNEFDSPDELGSGEKMDATFLFKVDSARHLAGIPFKVNSGYRTKEHNEEVGGVNGSSHTKGLAVDIGCGDGSSRFKIVKAAMDVGITRIGVSGSFIHLDDDKDKAQNVIWTY